MKQRGVLIIAGSAFLLMLVVVVILLVRSRGNTSSSTTLTIWSPFDEQKTYDQISQDFLSKTPNVTINFKYISAKDSQDYEAKVVNAIANGQGPDIWLVRSDWIPKHVDKSTPSTWVAVKGQDSLAQAKAKLISSVVDLNTYNGKLYGVPLSADSLAIIYNQDYYNAIYAKATDAQKAILSPTPKSWEDLKAQTALASTVKGDAVTSSGLALGNTSILAPSDVLTAFLTQSGVGILSDDSKNVTFNVAKYVNGLPTFPATEALSFFTSFSTPGQPNYSWNSTTDSESAFLAGKTGAIIGYWSTLKDIVNQKPSFKMLVAALPQKTVSESSTRVDYGITWSHIVNSKSSNQTLAWNYLSYLMERSVQASYASATGKIPVFTEESLCANALDRSAESDSDAAKSIFTCQLYSAGNFIKPEWQQVDEILQDAITQVVYSKQTAQNSVDTAAERLKVFQK